MGAGRVADCRAATRGRLMLQVYVAAHCPGCDTARRRLARFQERYPTIPARLIDLDAPGAQAPPQIIGVPMYTWDGQVIFRGNPTERELIERVVVLHGGGDTRVPG